LLAFGDGESGATPFRVTVFKSTRAISASLQCSDGVVGIGAVPAAAVRDDLRVLREALEVASELADRDGSRAHDVPGVILRVRSDVEYYDVARTNPRKEFVGADGLQPAAITEVCGREVADAGDVFGGDRPQRCPELFDALGRESVDDTSSFPSRRHQAGSGERLQVMRRVRHTLLDLDGELVDRSLTLGENIDDLGAPPTRERLRCLGERVEQGVLGGAVPHVRIQLPVS
jgi:hypothetical protein